MTGAVQSSQSLKVPAGSSSSKLQDQLAELSNNQERLEAPDTTHNPELEDTERLEMGHNTRSSNGVLPPLLPDQGNIGDRAVHGSYNNELFERYSTAIATASAMSINLSNNRLVDGESESAEVVEGARTFRVKQLLTQKQRIDDELSALRVPSS